MNSGKQPICIKVCLICFVGFQESEVKHLPILLQFHFQLSFVKSQLLVHGNNKFRHHSGMIDVDLRKSRLNASPGRVLNFQKKGFAATLRVHKACAVLETGRPEL